MPKEIPILFSTPMVQAIMSGNKTMTRRVVKFRNKKWRLSLEANEQDRRDLDAFGVNDENGNLIEIEEGMPGTLKELNFCKWEVGDILWVRETFQTWKLGWLYKASYGEKSETAEWKWKPSIFMPKEACRIWLEVTGVKVERLQEISWDDAVAEGCPGYRPIQDEPPQQFKRLWQEINGNWDENPWVWCVSFKVLSTTGKP